jgi:hypothetical protein
LNKKLIETTGSSLDVLLKNKGIVNEKLITQLANRVGR